jgi:hypothetical protein
MAASFPASIMERVLGLAMAPTEPAAGNRFSLEGLSFAAGKDGVTVFGVRKFEASALRLSSGPLLLEVGHLAVHELKAELRMEGGRPRLGALQAAGAEFASVKVNGPLHGTAGLAAAGSWSLVPLATAEGTIRAEIVDAHLVFDADVTVPIRRGTVDFKDATVEHVGPDSRMGASRLGIYVDAPNGRSYLYQFATSPVPGVEYERRGAMLGAWVTDRGKLQLQPFLEWLLVQPGSGKLLGVTEQARLLFDRTKASGEVRLGDGSFAAPGLRADLSGRAEGRNTVRLHSEAVGRGLTLEIASLLVRNAVLGHGGTEARCDDVAGTLMLRLSVDSAQLRFAFELPKLKMTGLHLQLQR